MVNSTGIKKAFIYIIIIIIFIGVLFFFYYIGLKNKAKNKTKVKEMKDDDYEYVSVKNKDINGADNKGPKIVELNTVLGIWRYNNYISKLIIVL